jgi:hypothetical protein
VVDVLGHRAGAQEAERAGFLEDLEEAWLSRRRRAGSRPGGGAPRPPTSS